MSALLSVKHVAAKVSISVSQIRRLVKAGIFPQPIKLSPGRIVWHEKDIDAWIDNLKGGQSDD